MNHSSLNIANRNMTVLHLASDLEAAEEVRINLENLNPTIRVNLFVSLDEVFNCLNNIAPYQMEPQPDLILLGAKLPFMTGLEFIEILKRFPAHQYIPVAGIAENKNSGSMTTISNANIVLTVRQSNFQEEFLRIEDLIMDYWTADQTPSLLQ